MQKGNIYGTTASTTMVYKLRGPFNRYHKCVVWKLGPGCSKADKRLSKKGKGRPESNFVSSLPIKQFSLTIKRLIKRKVANFRLKIGFLQRKNFIDDELTVDINDIRVKACSNHIIKFYDFDKKLRIPLTKYLINPDFSLTFKKNFP